MSHKITPVVRWKGVTPSDTALIEPTPDSITAYTTAGVITIQGDDGVNATVYLALGVPFPCRPRRILATGAVAAGITALYN